MKRLLPDLLILLGLLLLAVLFFAPVTLGGRTLVPADNLYQYEPWASHRAEQGVPEVPHNALLSDLVFQNYQWKTFLRESFSTRELPLWQPNQFSGTPFLANGQHSGLYPFSIIYYVLPLTSAFGWFTVSQLWLAGALMYVFIRGLRLSRAAGLVAAMAYALGSFSMVSTVHPMIQAAIAWLPLILLMLEFIIQRCAILPGKEANPVYDALPWVLIGGAALGMNFLAGHIEISYYTLLIMALYAALRLGPDFIKNMRGQLATLAMLMLTAILGLCLGAVQFIPLVEAAGDSFRTERSSLDEVLGYALPKRHVIKWLLPNAYGNPAHHSYVDVFEWESVPQDWTREDETRVTNTDFGIKNYVEGGAYLGILTLALAAIGLLRARAPYRMIFALMGLISAAFMFGTALYALLYYLFPGIDQLHTPFRWLWPFTFVLATLAAFGMDYVQRVFDESALTPSPALPLRGEESTPATVKGEIPSPRRGGIKGAVFGEKLAAQVGITVVLIGGLSLAGLLLSRLFFASFEPMVSRIYDGLAGANQAFPNAEAFYSYQFRNVLIFALMTTGAGAAILISRWRKSIGWRDYRAPVWVVIAIVVLAVDLFLASGDFNTAADSDWLDFTPPSVAWLVDQQEKDGPFRIQAYDWGERPLIANTGWRYGLQDVRGYDSLFSKEYADYMAGIAPQTGLDFNRINPIFYDDPGALLAPQLDWLNVRYIITDWIIRPDEEFGVDDLDDVNLKLVYEDAGVRIYENTDALPRVFTLPLDADFTALPEEFGAATISSYESSTIFVDVETEDDVWLILSESYHEGWRAFLRPLGAGEDAEDEIPVSRVAGNLRAVQLEPGAWTLRFRYSPTSFQLGAFTSFVSGMVVIFLALLWLWRSFVGDSADQDSARRVFKNSLAPIILNLFNRGIDFAFAFVMLRILAPEGAGIYYYAIVIFGWFDILTNFGLNTLLTREVSRDQSQARRYLVNTTGLRLGLAGLGLPVLVAFLLIRNEAISPPLDETAIIAILLLYVGLIPNSISTGLSALFYAFEKAEYPAALTTVSTLVKVSLGLGALLAGWGVVGLAAASILTNAVTLVLMSYQALPLIVSATATGAGWLSGLSAQLMRGMMGESWPLMLNHLLATVFFKSDVILMEAINGVVIVGIYSTAYKWLDALNIIPAFFTLALLPLMSRQAHEDPKALARNYVFGFKSLVMVALPLAVVTTFIAPALIGVLGGAEFLPDGGIALQIMIWSIPLGWINSLTQYVLIALDRQRQITFAFVAAVSFNVGANLIFLPEYSFRAAAVTTIFSEMALLVGFYYLLRKDLGDVNYVSVLWRPVAASGVMLAALLALWNVQALLALFAAALIYLVVLMILKPLTTEEANRIGRIVPSRLKRFVLRA